MELFDSHAHYDDAKFNIDRENIIKEVYESGVTKLVSAGYSLESSKRVIELAKQYDFIYATCGISPNDIPDTKGEFDAQLEELKKLINEDKNVDKNADKNDDKKFENNNSTSNSNKVVAIGEIGLDYYWNKENKELQKYAFIKQIELANNANLPIVIHTREAIMDTLDILKNIKKPIKPGVFHCCPLNVELVKEAVKLGFYISFAGPVTFKNSKNAQEVVKLVPLDKILIETDSPYLSPEPKRGTRNNSANVRYICEKVAEFKNVTAEELAKQTYENAKKVFEIIE